MLRACSRAQHRPESATGALDWPPPANFRAAPPRERISRRPAPPPSSPFNQIHPIRNQRIRLDPEAIKSEPLDLDPRAHIETYPFGLADFIKSPWVLLELSRSPAEFKTNSS